MTIWGKVMFSTWELVRTVERTSGLEILMMGAKLGKVLPFWSLKFESLWNKHIIIYILELL